MIKNTKVTAVTYTFRKDEHYMVFEKVRAILAELLSIDENTITMDSLIIDNLGADSLDLVDAVVTLNDEFGVEVPDEEIENLRSVGDVVRYIEANME